MSVLAAFANLWLITKSMEAAELFAGLNLVAIVGIYFLSVHVSPRIARLLPKNWP